MEKIIQVVTNPSSLIHVETNLGSIARALSTPDSGSALGAQRLARYGANHLNSAPSDNAPSKDSLILLSGILTFGIPCFVALGYQYLLIGSESMKLKVEEIMNILRLLQEALEDVFKNTENITSEIFVFGQMNQEDCKIVFTEESDKVVMKKYFINQEEELDRYELKDEKLNSLKKVKDKLDNVDFQNKFSLDDSNIGSPYDSADQPYSPIPGKKTGPAGTPTKFKDTEKHK